MIKVTIGSESFTAESLDTLTDEQQKKLIAAYSTGNAPKVEPFVSSDLPFPVTTPATRLATAYPFPSDEGPKGANDAWDPTAVDAEAKKRIDAQHVALQASGIDVASAAKAASQVAENGVRMASSGYAAMAQRASEHAKKQDLRDVAHALIERVKRENRTDVTMSSADLGKAIVVNGKIHVNGRALTEQAIRGLAQRIESPMLGYVLGMRDRHADAIKAWRSAWQDDKGNVRPNAPAKPTNEDLSQIAEVLAYECKRNPDVSLKLRTRNGGVDDVFAIVSPQYSPADAPEVLAECLDDLISIPGAKGTWSYDPKSTTWEIRSSIWTPTAVAEQAIGEAFEGYTTLGGRDNGTGSFRGGGGITFIRCFNASTYTAASADVTRRHIGKVMADIDALMSGSLKAIDALINAWGMNRRHVVEVPKGVTIEQAIPGFWRHLLTARGSELARVLPGRTENHVQALSATFHAERRDRDNLVRADFGQAWTRHIQGQPSDVRRDAESAIGSWLVNDHPAMRVDMRDRDIETVGVA